jgi:hypothetical protein
MINGSLCVVLLMVVFAEVVDGEPSDACLRHKPLNCCSLQDEVTDAIRAYTDDVVVEMEKNRPKIAGISYCLSGETCSRMKPSSVEFQLAKKNANEQYRKALDKMCGYDILTYKMCKVLNCDIEVIKERLTQIYRERLNSIKNTGYVDPVLKARDLETLNRWVVTEKARVKESISFIKAQEKKEASEKKKTLTAKNK